jgi:hypothetical protein
VSLTTGLLAVPHGIFGRGGIGGRWPTGGTPYRPGTAQARHRPGPALRGGPTRRRRLARAPGQSGEGRSGLHRATPGALPHRRQDKAGPAQNILPLPLREGGGGRGPAARCFGLASTAPLPPQRPNSRRGLRQAAGLILMPMGRCPRPPPVQARNPPRGLCTADAECGALPLRLGTPTISVRYTARNPAMPHVAPTPAAPTNRAALPPPPPTAAKPRGTPWRAAIAEARAAHRAARIAARSTQHAARAPAADGQTRAAHTNAPSGPPAPPPVPIAPCAGASHPERELGARAAGPRAPAIRPSQGAPTAGPVAPFKPSRIDPLNREPATKPVPTEPFKPFRTDPYTCEPTAKPSASAPMTQHRTLARRARVDLDHVTCDVRG